MTIRIQLGTNEDSTSTTPSAVQPQALTRVHEGAIRFTAGQQESGATGGVTRHVVSFAGTPGGSIAATLQTINGLQTVEMEPGNPASRTVVQAVAREGLIRRNAAGQWEDAPRGIPNEATQSAPVQGEEVPDMRAEDAAIFDAQSEGEWNALIEPLPQFAYDRAVASTIGQLVAGGDLTNVVHGLAEASCIEPDQARALLEAGYSHYGKQVHKALAPLGIEGERMNAFIESLEKDQNRYHDAIQRLVYMRDLSGFRSAAVEFNRHNPSPLEGAARAAGMETSQDPTTGETLYRFGSGPWVTMAQLAAV